jgi:hypothetical protein
MSSFHTLSRVALVGAAAVACAAFAVPAANAAGAPQVNVTCDSGQSHFLCAAWASGGTAPYTYSWTPYVSNTYLDRNSCSPGNEVNVTVTVTDAAGASTSASGSVDCNPGAWD